jgi:hypothetical protein
MMHRSTTSFIRRYINSLKKNQLFSTRELLSFGPRGAIDQALWLMVKSGFLQRLARGVFVKAGFHPISPPAEEVAQTKARAFGKQITNHGMVLSSQVEPQTDPTNKQVFAVDASTSKFRYGEIIIYLRKTCPRKIALQDTFVGKTTRALWYLGKQATNDDLIAASKKDWNRADKEEAELDAQWLPAWLNKYFLRITPRWRDRFTEIAIDNWIF